MRSGRRRSSKQDANLFIMPIARSVAPSSNAPASEVTGPASNAATTLRPSTGANSKKFGVQSVGIGVLRESEINCCCTTIFADSQPRCTQFGERSALGSYETWSRWCRDPLLALGGQDPVERIKITKMFDSKRIAIAELYTSWDDRHGQT